MEGREPAFTLLLAPECRAAVVGQFRADYENFFALKKVDKPWALEWVNRATFQRLTVSQLGLCFQVEKWVWTPRLESLELRRQTRFVTQQIVEDSFNRIKKGVDLGVHTRCSTHRCWALPIDKAVVGKIHRYMEVDRTEILQARTPTIADGVFHPVVRKELLSEDMRSLSLARVVGFGEASWYSPQAASLMRPLCEMSALREARSVDALEKLDTVWLCRLVSKRMLFRRVHTGDWFIGIGDICGTLAVGWPATRSSAANTFLPVVIPGVQARLFTILNLDDWEARPFEIHSPLHVAVAQSGGQAESSVTVGPSSNCGRLTMVAVPTGPVEPLKVVAARGAFAQLPLAALRTLCTFGLTPGTSLLECISALARHLLPQCTDEEVLAVLRVREVNFEICEDVRDMLAAEAFDQKDVPALVSELKGLKSQREEAWAFQVACQEFRENILGGKQCKAAAKSRKAILAKHKCPQKLPEWKTGDDDLPQSEARRLLPLGCSIWRGNFAGSWQVRLPPHPRHSVGSARAQQPSGHVGLCTVRMGPVPR